MNVSLNKELVVLMMGPIFQIIAYLILVNIPFFYNDRLLIKSIHYSILTFNLLPIYPLDGGKLFNIFLNYRFNFNLSMKIVVFTSYFIVLVLFTYFLKTEFSLNIILMLCFLLYKIKEESNKRSLYYDKFLLERYLNNYSFKKKKKVSSINHLYRDRSHIIKGKDRYYTEKEILTKKFRKFLD